MAEVQVDTAPLERYTRNLAAGLTAGGPRTARAAADWTAGEIRRTVPHRTGRLAASVSTITVPDGYGVGYGTGVPYAGYIERRTHAVNRAVATGTATYRTASIALARTEVRRA